MYLVRFNPIQKHPETKREDVRLHTVQYQYCTVRYMLHRSESIKYDGTPYQYSVGMLMIITATYCKIRELP
jgi:hypothetical protein